MNRREIGRKFEKEAIEYLKDKFDTVEWLSKGGKKSTFDFMCVRDGKKYFGEAKTISYTNKPHLTKKQEKADFVITKIKGKIKYFEKEDINKNCNISKNYTRTITVDEDNWRELSEIKLRQNFSTIDATIKALLNNTRRLKVVLEK